MSAFWFPMQVAGPASYGAGIVVILIQRSF